MCFSVYIHNTINIISISQKFPLESGKAIFSVLIKSMTYLNNIPKKIVEQLKMTFSVSSINLLIMGNECKYISQFSNTGTTPC